MIREVPLKQGRVDDTFWRFYLDLIREKTIPYQYRALNNDSSVSIENENKKDKFQDKKSNAIENLRIAAGLSRDKHYGAIYQDSDLYKWLEAAGYSLQLQDDPKLREMAGGIVELIAAAQREDGYIHSYIQTREPDMQYRLMFFSHELYCMGHLLEALIAWHQATGDAKALQIADKIVQHLSETFGYEEGKMQGTSGHQEIEIALIRYYEYTGNETALDLADFFLDVRGKDPEYFLKQAAAYPEHEIAQKFARIPNTKYYLQAYAQPRKQREAHGHAVRMMYMAAAMARLCRHRDNPELWEACKAIWDDVTKHKMYVTAGIGSVIDGEAFSAAYDLPNDTIYAETCASVALVYFAYEMFKNDPDPSYFEVIETALYNGILAGASRDGVHFFYVNPLEVHMDIADRNPGMGHIKNIRPQWYSCACCPPNFARTIGSIQRYICCEDEENGVIYVNLPVSSEFALGRGELKIEAEEGRTYIRLMGRSSDTLKIRIPRWASDVRACCGKKRLETPASGFLTVPVSGDDITVTLEYCVPVLPIRANHKVVADAGKLAVRKGPFIYCAEQIDNDHDLCDYRVSAAAVRNGKSGEISFGATGVFPMLEIEAEAEIPGSETLYDTDEDSGNEPALLRMIPYYAWANRACRDMQVWLIRK